MSFKKFTAGIAAAVLIGLSGCGQSNQAAWDTNADGELDRGEFYQSAYKQWDTNKNGYVTYEEFEDNVVKAKVWKDWDKDSNSLLSFSEYDKALEDLRLENSDLLDRYSEFDADSNGSLGVVEFARGLYTVWDNNSDGGVTPAEFQDSMEKYAYFASLDSDEDGIVDDDLANAKLWDID